MAVRFALPTARMFDPGKRLMTNIYDKTAKGREEIATRKYHLAPRLRTLLVLVDGKQTDATLLQKVEGIGLHAESIAELLTEGFIEAVHAPPEAVPAPSPAALPTDDMAARYQAIYRFFTETIKSTIGLRGYGLQLKVEKAASIDDFRALRQPYLDAVLKAKGSEIEQSLRGRLDQLLNAAPEVDAAGDDARADPA